VRTGELVFFGSSHGRPLAEVTLTDQLRRLDHGNVTVHGFRSSFRNWCTDTGKPADLAEAALAHTPGNAVVQAYRRSDLFDPRRKLMADWAADLSRPPAKVVALRLG